MSEVKTVIKRELPKGWQWVKLNKLGNFEAGGTPSKDDNNYWDGNIPFVTGADITELFVSKNNARAFLTSEGLSSGKTAICYKDTVLIVTRTRVGRAGIASETMGASQDITAFICGPKLDPSFLCRYLHNVSKYLIDNSRGATIQGLTRDFVDNIEIPLPPLPEQQRISLLLKQQMAAVDAARLAAQQRLGAIKALPAAYLRQVFPNPGAALPAGWRWVKLGEVCEINPRRPIFERPDNKPTSFIPMEAVDALSGTVIDKRAKPYLEIKKGYTFFADKDVLFAKITPCMQNGKHTIADDLIDGIGFGTTEFHVLRAHNEIIPEWVWYFVRQPDLLMEATEHFTGAVGQQRLPSDYLANLTLPLPSLPEQQRIAACLKEQMAAVEQARLAAEAELNTINSLPSALLRRAFNGEL